MTTGRQFPAVPSVRLRWCLTQRVALCLIKLAQLSVLTDGRHLTLASFPGLCGMFPPVAGRHKKLNEQLQKILQLLCQLWKIKFNILLLKRKYFLSPAVFFRRAVIRILSSGFFPVLQKNVSDLRQSFLLFFTLLYISKLNVPF